METRKFGKTDMEFSVLGFGGWEIGSDCSTTQEQVERLLNSALDGGMNVIDTAAAYFSSERMIGEAVGKRRKEFYLLTKCGALDGFSRYDWTKKGIVETIEQSLRNLKTDYLDVAQLHTCSAEELRRGEVVEGLQRAQEKGYTRFIGYSGDNDDAKTALEMDVFDSFQTSVNIADQTPIDGNIKLAAKKGLGVIAKRPVANVVWREKSKPENGYFHAYWDRLEKLQLDFLKKPLQESVSDVLRFTLTIPNVAVAIVGTTQPQRFQENADFVRQGNLSAEEYEAIRNRWREVAGEDWIGMT